MYVKITNRCNLRCAHCAYSCTIEGQDMTMTTFENTCHFYNSLLVKDAMVLGGGEPTLNHLFPHFVRRCKRHNIFPQLTMNGVDEHRTMRIARLFDAGFIEGAMLGYTPLHRAEHRRLGIRYSEKVLERFENTEDKMKGDSFIWGHGLLTGNLNPVVISKVGRARTLKNATEECLADDMLIEPNGIIRACLCPNGQVIGNVNDLDFNKRYKFVATSKGKRGCERGELICHKEIFFSAREKI